MNEARQQHEARESSAAATKGRVVILVDNDVRRDSRVQKQARSMADAGWDVVLLGHAPPGQSRRRWQIGRAQVRLVPAPRLLHRRPGDLRRTRLRDPLAYSSGWLAEARTQAVKARQADLRVRRIETATEGASTPERLGVLAARAATKAQDRWVSLRADHTQRLTQRKLNGDGWIDRVSTTMWQKILGDDVWRRFDPHLWDWDLGYGPEIDRLRPDIIHANDFRMLGVGARAVVRAREQGRHPKLVWDSHEFLPGIRPREEHPRWHLAQMAHERTYAGAADAVVTVSDELATLLRETHNLPEQPAVVCNCPYAADMEGASDAPSIREMVGAEPSQRVMVYSGVASPARGLEVMIEALPELPDVICALVVNRPDSDYVRQIQEQARRLGVVNRVKVLPYVPFDQVVPFLSSADFGTIPINHWLNHEIQLITKYFEYAHARLPIVVSDVRVMAETATRLGHGEVFTAGDASSFVAAARKVLADPESYRRSYTDEQLKEWTWEAQAEVLDAVYDRVLGK